MPVLVKSKRIRVYLWFLLTGRGQYCEYAVWTNMDLDVTGALSQSGFEHCVDSIKNILFKPFSEKWYDSLPEQKTNSCI